MEHTLIKRIEVCSAFSSKSRVLRGCAWGRVVGHGVDRCSGTRDASGAGRRKGRVAQDGQALRNPLNYAITLCMRRDAAVSDAANECGDG